MPYTNPKLERYYYLLLKFFDLADCQVNIKFSPWLLLNLRNYSDLIYKLKNLKILLLPPKKFDLWLTNDEKNLSQKNVLVVDLNYFTPDKASDGYIFPYNMHPDVYESDLYKTIPELHKVGKSIRVFFGGNTGKGYGNPDIPKLFGKITRNDIISILEAIPDKIKVVKVTNREESNLLLAGEMFGFVIAKKPVFTLENWMKILARSSFYIAAPGFSMPFSHNVIEAMSVGTIPILQYPEMFNPPLTDTVDCLTFDDENDLIEKINIALDMEAETLAAMRKAVLKYYEENLEPKSAVENLFDRLPFIQKLYINAEHISILELKKQIYSRD